MVQCLHELSPCVSSVFVCSSGDLVVHLLQGGRGWISRSEVVSCSHLFQYFRWNWFRINTVSSRGFGGDCFNRVMLGREVVVIIGWVGLGQEAQCGNGKIPPGGLGLRLLSSSILLVGLGGGSMGRASFVVKRGV